MGPYWIVWTSILLLSFLAQYSDYVYDDVLTAEQVEHTSNAKLYYILGACLLIVVAGCRYYVGADFGGYYWGYKKYAESLMQQLMVLDEPGLPLVYSIAVAISDSPNSCLFAAAAVTLGLTLITIFKNTDQIGMALILFTVTVWSACFNGMRQALAAAVLFCGFPALRDRNFFKYALCVALAFLCHRSSIVMILMWFAVHRPVTRMNIFITAAASVGVLYSYDMVYQVVGVVMDMESTDNLGSYWRASVNILRVLSHVAPAVWFVLCYTDKEPTEESDFYLNLLILSAVVSVTTAGSTCMARMCMYMSPFALMSLVELPKRLERHRELTCIGMVAAYWFMEFYEISHSGSLCNFRFVWEI